MLEAPNRLLIEQDYVSSMGLHLQQFHWTPSLRVATFRCPICGDSKKNKRKTRGYIYINPSKRTYYTVKCHNCGYCSSFLYFVKQYYGGVFSQLRVDLIQDILGGKKKEVKFDESVFITKPLLKKGNAISINDLADDHPAKAYCIRRKIPSDAFSKILYVDNYKKYISTFNEEKAEKLPEDPRILFELKNTKGEIFGVQGRVIETIDAEGNLGIYHLTIKNYKSDRFITIKFDELADKLYGTEYLNTLQPVFVTEGVIDSYFLPNSLALVGGDVLPNLDKLLGCSKENIYIVLDNEPRNKDTVNRMDKAISYGYNVYFWNVDTKYKDINKMILNGMSAKTIEDKVLNDSLSGFRAKMKLSSWRKI